jgi:hypothetical protein
VKRVKPTSTKNTEKGKYITIKRKKFGKCGPRPDFAGYTLAFALQLRRKPGKTSVRVVEKRCESKSLSLPQSIVASFHPSNKLQKNVSFLTVFPPSYYQKTPTHKRYLFYGVLDECIPSFEKASNRRNNP